MTLLSAPGGGSKSLLTLDLAIRLAAGRFGSWLSGFQLPGIPMPVTIIEAECGRERLERRVREMVMGESFPPETAHLAADNLVIYPAENFKHPELVLVHLSELLAVRPTTVLIIDPLRSFLPASVEDENDNVVMGRAIDAIVRAAKATGTGILVNDHDSKAGAAARGAMAKQDSAEFVAHLTGPDEHDADYLELTMTKQRDPGGCRKLAILRVCSPPTDDGLYPVRFEFTELRSAKPNGEMLDKSIRALADFLIGHPGCTKSEASAYLLNNGHSRSTIQRGFSALMASGAIRESGDKRNKSPIVDYLATPYSSAHQPTSAQRSWADAE
jgi:hypothetical protein